jgi:hypothetical protein
MTTITEYLIRAQIRDGMEAPTIKAIGAALEVGTEDAPEELGFNAVAQWTVHDAAKRYELSDREHATVLAALRAYQWVDETLKEDERPDLSDIVTNCGKVKALDAAEIDALCERLNTGAAG